MEFLEKPESFLHVSELRNINLEVNHVILDYGEIINGLGCFQNILTYSLKKKREEWRIYIYIY